MHLDIFELKPESPGGDMQRDHQCIGRRMLRLEVPGRRLGERPKRSFMDVVKEDIRLVG